MGLKDYIFAHEPPASVHGHVNARRSSASRTKRLSLASSEETSTTEPSTAEPSLPDFDHSEHEMVVAYIYQQQCSKFWIGNMKSDNEGAFMRVGRGNYVTCPEHLKDSPLAAACEALNVQIGITVHSKIIKAFFAVENSLDSIILRGNLQIQIIPSIQDLSIARKHQFAAFIREGSFLLVWDDDPSNIVARAADIELQLVEISWRKATGKYPTNQARKDTLLPHPIDEEAGMVRRPRIFISSVMSGVTMILIFGTLGLGWKALAQQVAADGSYLRLGLFAMAPISTFFCLFFMQVIVGCLFQLFGPIAQMQTNTRYYSGQPPIRSSTVSTILPHVTIQAPVYTESLEAVVEPTIKSLKAAISTYEMQGGSATIFVNDDGMLAKLSESEIEIRKQFYQMHNIAWVARPPHNPDPKDGEKIFLRRGRFKKASNMNYALMVTTKVEDKLLLVERGEHWGDKDENVEYERCLAEVLQGLGNGTLAGGNIRMGDYILLVDSDTRVPEDCLLDAVTEMEQSPEVAILQYVAGVLHVADDFFENGISFFTDLIYTSISYAIANGDMAPFVGHNAILRWTALQDVAYFDEDKYVKIWSECSVSEDFDMSLRLQSEGWTIRLGTYSGQDYKEGVSLTVFDELTRWEKYAYGCSELLFHPLKDWPRHGPFPKLIRTFLCSNQPLTMKISTLGYVGTYYAIGSAWILVAINYFIVGWSNGQLDRWYLNSFDVFFTLVVVFSFVCNVTLAVLRYRLGTYGFLSALIENFKWLLLFAIFFGGISLSVSQALLCHLFSIDISWSTTQKEVKVSNFWKEVPFIISQCKARLAYCFTCFLAMILLGLVVPYQWKITEFTAIFPLAIVSVSHFLLPIALNPAMMRFTW